MPTTVCLVPFKVKKVRFTLLDSCGTVVTGSCSTISTDGVITIEQAITYEDREEFYVKNADGKFCVQETNPPIIKWIQNTVTMCNVDPEIVAFVTGGTIVLDDYDGVGGAKAVGNSIRTNDPSLVNFGFEAWTGVTNASDGTCATAQYGYVLWPWMVEGTMGDVTYENGAANFQWIARTKVGSNWGTGPYSVLQSQATATLNNPIPLLTAIASDEHRRMLRTFEPPPISGCGCTALPNPNMSMVDSGTHIGTLTLPTAPWPLTQTLPATVDWGDSSTTTIAAGAGPTVPHTYAMAGTYTVTFRSKVASAATWSTPATPIA